MRKRLKTIHIGASPFMEEAWVKGSTGANFHQGFGGGTHFIHNHTIACRSNKDGAADRAQAAGNFDQKFVGTPDEILNHALTGGFEVIRIATPDADHAFYACPALAQGINVFCEKGLAHTLADAEKTAAAASASKAFAVVEYNYPGLKAVAKFRKLIAEGRIVGLSGQAYGAIIRFLQDWGIGNRDNWRFNYELAGLTGVLGDLGTHIIHAILWCLGPLNDPVVAVEGSITYYDGFDNDLRFKGPNEVDVNTRAVDASIFTLITKSGAKISGETGRHYRFSKADTGLEVFGIPGGKLKWELADLGRLQFTEHTGVPGDERGMKLIMCDSFVPGLTGGFDEGHGNGILDVLKWLDGDRTGNCPGASFAEGLHCLKIAEAIRQAGITGTRITLEAA